MFNLPRYKYLYALLDFFLIMLSFVLSNVLNKYNGNVTNFSLETIAFMIMMSGVFLLFFQSNNLYKINVLLSIYEHLILILKSLFQSIVAFIFIAFLLNFPNVVDSRKFIFIFLLILLVLLIVFRIWIIRWILVKVNPKIIKRNVIIVGAGKSGKLISTKLQFEKFLGLSVIGFLDDNIPSREEVIAGLYNLGSIDDISDIVRKHKIDEIIIAIDKISYERLLEILEICNNIKGVIVKISSDLFQIIPEKIITEKYSDFSVVNLSPQINREKYYYFKRLIDILGAGLGLAVFSPVFLIIAILIKLSSPGPVLYKQVRIGKNGKPFNFLKFRSMKMDDEDDEKRKEMMLEFMKGNNTGYNGTAKIINIDRVTWIGKIIRKTSIDEIPQLINVLKGEMSLVGPRPSLPYEFENYDEWQKVRVSVLPGCTGIWQVYGRSSVSFKDSVVMDIYYINNMSPWLDLQLILKTIPVMISGKGGE